MKRFLLLLSVWAFLFSCTRGADENSVLSPQVPEPVSPYAVPESEALQSLAAVLQQIDGSDETRAGGVRKPLSIRSVKASDVYETTRSSADLPDLDNLFYVVSFGEGNGSAVLGADRRVEPVIAILDETVLTEDDFQRKTSCPDENIDDFLIGLMSDAAELSLSISIPHVPLRRVEEVPIRTQSPRLKTKWHQRNPYNDQTPIIEGTHSPAGCVPVAIAQFLAYFHCPEDGYLNSEYFNWELLDQCVYGSTSPSARPQQEAARFIYNIGVFLGADYGPTGTSVSLRTVPAKLALLGMESDYRDLDVDLIEQIVCEKGPVCIRGRQMAKGPNAAGHSWLVDGWNSYLLKTWGRLFDEEGNVVSEFLANEKECKYVHCCFGHGGGFDGYYSCVVLNFDLSEPLDAKYVDTSVGDIRAISSNGTVYDYDFSMINY